MAVAGGGISVSICHLDMCVRVCYNQTLLGKHTSKAAYQETLNGQWHTPLFLSFSGKQRNLLACVCSSDLSAIHGHERQFEHWLQTFMLRQPLDPWAVFKFPTNLAPALAPQPRRTQTRADITTSGSHLSRFPLEQIRPSDFAEQETKHCRTVENSTMWTRWDSSWAIQVWQKLD